MSVTTQKPDHPKHPAPKSGHTGHDKHPVEQNPLDPEDHPKAAAAKTVPKMEAPADIAKASANKTGQKVVQHLTENPHRGTAGRVPDFTEDMALHIAIRAALKMPNPLAEPKEKMDYQAQLNGPENAQLYEKTAENLLIMATDDPDLRHRQVAQKLLESTKFAQTSGLMLDPKTGKIDLEVVKQRLTFDRIDGPDNYEKDRLLDYSKSPQQPAALPPAEKQITKPKLGAAPGQ